MNYNDKLQKFSKKKTKIVQTRNYVLHTSKFVNVYFCTQNSSYCYYNLSRHNCRKRTTNLSRTILLRDVCLPRRQQKRIGIGLKIFLNEKFHFPRNFFASAKELSSYDSLLYYKSHNKQVFHTLT